MNQNWWARKTEPSAVLAPYPAPWRKHGKPHECLPQWVPQDVFALLLLQWVPHFSFYRKESKVLAHNLRVAHDELELSANASKTDDRELIETAKDD